MTTINGSAPSRERGALDARALNNPAFAAALVGRTASSYGAHGLPLPYVFLVAPMVLNDTVRDQLPKRANRQLAKWALENPLARSELRGGAYAHRTTTRMALRFGIRHDVLRLTRSGVVAGARFDRLPIPDSGEAAGCWKAADVLGRWLARSDDQVTALALLGVTP